jgi:hypothetical protein
MEREKSQCSDLIVKASIKRKPRFKAGSELSGKPVNKLVSVEVNDTTTEDSEAFDITLHFRSCANAEGFENCTTK